MRCITVALRQQAGRQLLTRSERSLPKRSGKSPGIRPGCPDRTGPITDCTLRAPTVGRRETRSYLTGPTTGGCSMMCC